MILFNPQATNKFTCIPREYVTSAFMTIRDDSTNVVVDYTLEIANIEINNDKYVVIYGKYKNMVEGHFYDLTLYSDEEKTNVIYRDRIFCTAQDINQTTNNHYKINEGQFTSYDGYNNDFIVV
jgi:hypothetical protein